MEFCLGGVADGDNLSLEVHGHACHRVVEVYSNIFVGDVEHHAWCRTAFGGHHCDGCAYIDVFAVKLAVHLKHLARQFLYQSVLIFAEAVLRCDCEVETFACGLAADGLADGWKHIVLVAIDETFGFLFGHLEHEFFLAVFAHLIEFVGHLDKLSFFNFVHIVDFCCFKS